MTYHLIDLFMFSALCSFVVALTIHFAYLSGRDALRDYVHGDYAGAVMNLVLSVGNLVLCAACGLLFYREVIKWMA